MPDDDRPTTDLPYDAAMHAMQTGVAYDLKRDPSSGTPKHLRVGVNSALVNDAALVRVLVAKGVFTMEEYLEALRLEACREVDRYEARLSEGLAAKVTLR